MEGALHGFTDPVRQMDICCIDGDAACILVDADDAIERMLALFGFLLMAHQVNHLLNLLPSEARGRPRGALFGLPAHQRQVSGRPRQIAR
jgi:hypothetical protein